jgi:hypothetical protein
LSGTDGIIADIFYVNAIQPLDSGEHSDEEVKSKNSLVLLNDKLDKK